MISRTLGSMVLLLWQTTLVAQGLQPGAYVLTISPAGGDDPACSNLRGTEEITVLEGSVRSTLITGLRIDVSSDDRVSGSGFESMTGWGAATSIKGKRTATGFGGDGVGERAGQYCYATWILEGPRPPR